jgi:hypothetical protein
MEKEVDIVNEGVAVTLKLTVGEKVSAAVEVVVGDVVLESVLDEL